MVSSRPAVLAHAAARDAAQEADGVRMARIVQHLLGAALLDHLAGVQHADLRAHLADHAEVVADEQDGRVELGLEVVDEVEHLGLDRRVEAGRRLVEDQQGRVDAERHRDHDALLHAARELVRVALHDRLRVRDLHLLEHRERALVGLAAARAARRVDLGELLADADRRVQRGARVLVHHRDDLAAVALQVGPAQAEDVDARDLDRARAHAPVARQVADRRQRRRRLAAAGLAHEPVGRAALDAEADAAQDLAPDAADAVVDLEVAHVERGCGRGAAELLARRGGRGAHRSNTCWRLSASMATAMQIEVMARPGKSTCQ